MHNVLSLYEICSWSFTGSRIGFRIKKRAARSNLRRTPRDFRICETTKILMSGLGLLGSLSPGNYDAERRICRDRGIGGVRRVADQGQLVGCIVGGNLIALVARRADGQSRRTYDMRLSGPCSLEVAARAGNPVTSPAAQM